MNKHILFVIDHLANPGKYTQEEVKANKQSARAANSADATYCAYCAYATRSIVGTTYWVDEYFKATGEDKQIYIDKLRE
jgi:hypothetical protein